MFVFLNKTCYGSVYYVTPEGRFRTSHSNSFVNSKLKLDKQIWDYLSKLIQNVIFTCCSYERIFNNIQKDDFVYLDPPYVPVKKKTYVDYTKQKLTKDDHIKLFNHILNLHTRGVNFIMNNTKVDLILDYFKDFKLYDMTRLRRLNNRFGFVDKIKECTIINF